MNATAPRVAVTRDEPPNGPLASALRECGLEPVDCATVREAGAPDPARFEETARALGDYDWVIVTSRRAVHALQKARAQDTLPHSLRTAAVGASTAEALEEAGAVDPLCAAGSGVMSLIDLLQTAESWQGKLVLLPRAEEGRRELGEALRAAGATVHEVIAYRTVAVPPAEVAAAWRRADCDAVVLASPSAARALVDGVGVEALQRLRLVAAIGSTTRAALEALGVRAVTPASANFRAVAMLVAEQLKAPAIPDSGADRPTRHHGALRHEGGVS